MLYTIGEKMKIGEHVFTPSKAKRHYRLYLETLDSEKLRGDAYLSVNRTWYVRVPGLQHWEVLGQGPRGARRLLELYSEYLRDSEINELRKMYAGEPARINGHVFNPSKAVRHYELCLMDFDGVFLEGDAYLSRNNFWYIKVPEKYPLPKYWAILGRGKAGARKLLREYFDFLDEEVREEIGKTFHVRGPREKGLCIVFPKGWKIFN
jgi:hypothetical protein